MSSNSPSDKTPFPILPVVQKYLKTTPKGSNHWAICPFHKDTSPSLSISTEKNIFKCFSCNVAGDAIAFVMRIDGCGYVSAIKKITSILNLNVEDYLNKQENEYRKLHELNGVIADIYNKCLFNKSNEKHLLYLTEERGLTKEIINKYQIGYAPTEDVLSPVLEVHLKSEKTPWGESEIRRSKIFNYSQYGDKKPYFLDRIIFPVHNKDGQIIAFSGRSSGDNTPKYLNLKSNEIFSKKNAIFNIHHLKKDEPIYIFEGFIDLLKCQQHDFHNGVACMGGTMDVEVFKTLESFSKEIYLCMDNDEAGHTFTINLARSLVQNGFTVRVVNLLGIPHKDIDEYFKSNPEEAANSLKNPICCFEWYYGKSKANTLTTLQIFLDSTIDFLFINGRKLRPKINPDYAKAKIKYLFSLYGNLQDFSTKEYGALIENKIKEYGGFILGSVLGSEVTPQEIPKKTIPQQTEEAPRKTDFQQVTDPFLKLAIKYQKIIPYVQQNLSQFSKNDPWFIPIPERFKNRNREIDLIIKIFEDLSEGEFNFSEGDQKILDSLMIYEENSKKISDIADFYNRFYSFNQEYISILIEDLRRDRTISPEDRWIKMQDLGNFYHEIPIKASNFFINSSFSKNSEQ